MPFFFSLYSALNKSSKAIYCLMCDLNYFRLSIFFGIFDTTIAKYKSLLLICYKDYFEKRFVVCEAVVKLFKLMKEFYHTNELLKILQAPVILGIQFGY